MKSMLGCLFIFIFGGILLFIGLIRIVTQMLFGKGTSSTAKGAFGPFGSFGGFGNTNQSSHQQQAESTHQHTDTRAGNAHHEGNPNSRQKRSGKIFEKNEGKYVDFEEIH